MEVKAIAIHRIGAKAGDGSVACLVTPPPPPLRLKIAVARAIYEVLCSV